MRYSSEIGSMRAFWSVFRSLHESKGRYSRAPKATLRAASAAAKSAKRWRELFLLLEFAWSVLGWHAIFITSRLTRQLGDNTTISSGQAVVGLTRFWESWTGKWWRQCAASSATHWSVHLSTKMSPNVSARSRQIVSMAEQPQVLNAFHCAGVNSKTI